MSLSTIYFRTPQTLKPTKKSEPLHTLTRQDTCEKGQHSPSTHIRTTKSIKLRTHFDLSPPAGGDLPRLPPQSLQRAGFGSLVHETQTSSCPEVPLRDSGRARTWTGPGPGWGPSCWSLEDLGYYWLESGPMCPRWVLSRCCGAVVKFPLFQKLRR